MTDRERLEAKARELLLHMESKGQHLRTRSGELRYVKHLATALQTERDEAERPLLLAIKRAVKELRDYPMGRRRELRAVQIMGSVETLLVNVFHQPPPRGEEASDE